MAGAAGSVSARRNIAVLLDVSAGNAQKVSFALNPCVAAVAHFTAVHASVIAEPKINPDVLLEKRKGSCELILRLACCLAAIWDLKSLALEVVVKEVARLASLALLRNGRGCDKAVVCCDLDAFVIEGVREGVIGRVLSGHVGCAGLAAVNHRVSRSAAFN